MSKPNASANTATAQTPATQAPAAQPVRPAADDSRQYASAYKFQGMRQRSTREDYWNENESVVEGVKNDKLNITNIMAFAPTDAQAAKGSICKVSVEFGGVVLVSGFNVAVSRAGRLYVEWPYRTFERAVKKNGKEVLDGNGKVVYETQRALDIKPKSDELDMAIKCQILKALEPFISKDAVAQGQAAAESTEQNLQPSDIVG